MQEATGWNYEQMGCAIMVRGTDRVLFGLDIVFVRKTTVMQLPVT